MWPDDNKLVEDTKRFTVIRDTREHENQGWFWEPNDRCNGTIEACLKTGDYTIKGAEEFLCIERKASVAEIANNFSEKRFPAFLERFAQFKHKFLVAECSFTDVMMFPVGSSVPKNKWPYVQMKGKVLLKKIAEMQLQHGINVIWAGNSTNGWEFVNTIFKRIHEDLHKR